MVWSTLLLLSVFTGGMSEHFPQRKLPPAPYTALAGPERLKVGQLMLARCGFAYCGSVMRPLDPTGAVAGTIDVGFEFYPPRDSSQPPLGAIVATEGGPGYPTTGSRSYYLGLFEQLLDRRSLLLVDNRGTGSSSAVTCTPLQAQSQFTQSAIQSCGTQMGAAADLFSTGLAADDMAAVIQALALGVVDLYGDSYGTYFSQAFAGRHPEMLRSVVLDAAYAVTGADPWYPEAPLAAANAFDQSCRRSPACQELPGTSMSRIQALLGAVRANPVTAVAPNGDGTPSLVHANAQGLAYAMFSNASLVVYRELDAAARAWTDHMDQAPFLRLIAENQEAARSLPGNLDTTAFSAGLFVAVSCSDYPQIYSMTLGLEERLAQDAMVIRQKRADDPNVFAPFTIDEFLQMPLDYSVVNLCLRWPVPSLQYPPGQPVPPGTVFPGVPVLVLSGDLDSLTPVAQGAQAAALFPNASQVITANTGHVSALADPYRCASTIVRNFVQALSAGDTSCAALIPEVRLVPQFARTAGELDPASALPGNRGSAAELQVVSAAVLTAGDAMARWWVNYDRSGVGLRGGSFRYVPAGTHERFDLAGLQWTEEVAVSGSIDWDLLSGSVIMNLSVAGPQGVNGSLTVTYNQWAAKAYASISGTLAGHTIAATMYAP